MRFGEDVRLVVLADQAVARLSFQVEALVGALDDSLDRQVERRPEADRLSVVEVDDDDEGARLFLLRLDLDLFLRDLDVDELDLDLLGFLRWAHWELPSVLAVRDFLIQGLETGHRPDRPEDYDVAGQEQWPFGQCGCRHSRHTVVTSNAASQHSHR